MKSIVAFILLTIGCGSGQAAATGQLQGVADCSGRLAFTLPGDFEVATVPYQSLLRKISVFGPDADFRFTDSETAEFAKARYLGPMLISDELKDREIADAVKMFKNEKTRRAKNKASDVNRPFDLVAVPKFAENFDAWSVGSELRVMFHLHKHLFFLSMNNSDKVTENIASAVALAKNIDFRPKSTVPSGRGICLPYAAVRQPEQGAFGEVATLYKLNAHPDVTIMVSDSAMVASANGSPERAKAEKAAINDFWGQHQLYEDVQKVEKGFPLKNGESIELAGQKGTASFVRIIRKNGAVDYGYYGVSHGPVSKAGSANIAVYVVTHSQWAKDKSIEPVSSDAFLKMVELVQGSVVRNDK